MMQFPYPRKSSNAASSPFSPSPYSSARASSYSSRQRRGLKSLAPYLGGILAFVVFTTWLLGGFSSAGGSYRPMGTPEVIIVTTLDPRMSPTYKANLIENRKEYADRHGYGTFFPNTTDYDLMPGTPASWSLVPALRHAMASNPHTPWFWYLSPTALIMNSKEKLEDKLHGRAKLESLMQVDRPVVPPDSVIHTLNLSGDKVDFIISQDHDGLAGGSFFVRSGDWAKYFLDAWFDPLYRSYNFQKAEGNALEHIVQWHGTILMKVAIVPQRILNSYTRTYGPEEAIFQEGDFVANFHGCARDPARSCEDEMAPLVTRWREQHNRS